MSSSGNKAPEGLQRRDFLKLGASGFAVSLTGCASVSSTAADDAERMSNDAPADPPKPPRADGVVDPATLQSESWQEPWTWRPELWSGSRLDLNVVRSQNPGLSPSPGNPAPVIFSYNGASPGPTVRVRSDGKLLVRVRNTLELNEGDKAIGPCPEPFDLTPTLNEEICNMAVAEGVDTDPAGLGLCVARFLPEQFNARVKAQTVPGWAINMHLNGLYASHTTNLHTHGLHVFPQTNPDGSHSDNVHLRIIPQEDWQKRQASDDPGLKELKHNEHVGQLDYEIRLAFERDGKAMHHPPGTHWYHPHAHGATANQVSSGMAGFLIVEGDVDDAINTAMTGEARPNPEIPSGPYEYRERLIFIQRVQVNSLDPDAGKKRNQLRAPPVFAVNGAKDPGVFRMRPGAVERWRVLNGSVDGAGTKRFMVLEGQYVQKRDEIWRVVTHGDGSDAKRYLEPVSDGELENAKLDLQQLSFDGITLVTEENGKAVHRIRDLSLINAGTANPLIPDPRPGEDEHAAELRAFESVYRNGDSLRRAYARPNEVYLTNANRTDLFFKAPVDSAGKIFTIFAKEAHIHSDNHQQTLQRHIYLPDFPPRRPPFATVVAYIHVTGKPVEGGDFDIQDLNAHLPAVPPLLQPIHARELEVPAEEAAVTGVTAGSKRTRTISYSGTGATDWPLIYVPDAFADAHPELEDLTWTVHDGRKVLLPQFIQSMAINTEFDLRANPEPGVPRKFMPRDPQQSRVLVETAEEWVLYNTSGMLWGHIDVDTHSQPGTWEPHFISYPLSRADGQRRARQHKDFMITSKGLDHPFHIHINPIWVLRIDVPDENGELHNVLPQPMWMDTVAIPRNGGRVVFRTRFDDFTGDWVNHCHALQHEDNGMMQQIHCTGDPAKANYHPREAVAEHAMSAADVDAIYPTPSLELRYRQNLCFIDPNEIGYFEYPGFELEIPRLDG
jgi:FtsP/CotA-like multicopper oxidase with cupredoxin domain